jgi:anti-sigma B factor antagonist
MTAAVVRVALTGELDLESADAVGGRVREVLERGATEVVVDLAAVTFCDSTGVEALVAAHDTAARAGARLTVAHAYGITRRTLEITGVWPVLVPAG